MCRKSVQRELKIAQFWSELMDKLIEVKDPKHPMIGEGKQVASSLTTRTYKRLRLDILSGILEPGQKLKIEVMCRSYGTGATPIREALSLLTSDGLVERIDKRGFHVSKVSEKEFEELFKTRCWLEGLALRESIAHGGQRWEEAIVLAAYRLSRTTYSTADDHYVLNREWESHHKRFHMALIAACESSILLRFCDQLFDKNIRYRHLSRTTAYPKRDIEKEHEGIMKATLEHDAETAIKRLVAHYTLTGEYLRQGGLNLS
jgi:DNA-binding GntR family transcriptional regulator